MTGTVMAMPKLSSDIKALPSFTTRLCRKLLELYYKAHS
jgi:hypothetical protein